MAEGKLRPIYGLNTYTPEEVKKQWRESVEREWKLRKNHPTSIKEKQKIEQLKQDGDNSTPNVSYFNNNKSHTVTSPYDRSFHVQHGFHCKLKRDDREHTIGLNVHSEECSKAVPVLSSSSYGHRPPLEQPSRKHVRIALVRRDFYREGGTNLPIGLDHDFAILPS